MSCSVHLSPGQSCFESGKLQLTWLPFPGGSVEHAGAV
jgi:hypothetical protein